MSPSSLHLNSNLSPWPFWHAHEFFGRSIKISSLLPPTLVILDATPGLYGTIFEFSFSLFYSWFFQKSGPPPLTQWILSGHAFPSLDCSRFVWWAFSFHHSCLSEAASRGVSKWWMVLVNEIPCFDRICACPLRWVFLYFIDLGISNMTVNFHSCKKCCVSFQ